MCTTSYPILISITSAIQANAAGLSKELGISSRQYSIVLTIFYIPYILAEYPAALLMKKLGPHIMLPALTLSFGLVTALQGLVTSYGGLIACRLVLAVTEGTPISTSCYITSRANSLLLFIQAASSLRYACTCQTSTLLRNINSGKVCLSFRGLVRLADRACTDALSSSQLSP